MPTPPPGSGSTQFPELTTIANNLVLGLQALGVGMLAASVAILGLALWTSFGNEHRHGAVRAAAVSLLVGVAILANADTLATIIRRIFPL
jgi:hypothetical protein